MMYEHLRRANVQASRVQHGWHAHLFRQPEGVVGVQLRKGCGHVHFGQGLTHAVAGAIAEGEPPLALLAQVQPQVIHLLAIPLYPPLLLLLQQGLARGEQARLLRVLSSRLQAPTHPVMPQSLIQSGN